MYKRRKGKGKGAIVMAIMVYWILRAIARAQWVNRGNPVPALKIGALSKQEIINELEALRGRKIALHYQKTVDGVETAYHMVSRMLTQVSAQCVDSSDDAEVVAWIYAGQSHPFAYTITVHHVIPSPTASTVSVYLAS